MEVRFVEQGSERRHDRVKMRLWCVLGTTGLGVLLTVELLILATTSIAAPAVQTSTSEAEAWMESDDPDSFWLYPFYDLPGSAWGIDTVAYRRSDVHTNKILDYREGWEDYWDIALANFESA
jgi:hypothetical protein